MWLLQLAEQRTSFEVIGAGVAEGSRDPQDPCGHGCHPVAASIHQQELFSTPTVRVTIWWPLRQGWSESATRPGHQGWASRGARENGAEAPVKTSKV